jgi:osmotically-inducible protein OsmY
MVTLQGTVASLAVKATAEEIANDFPGVVFVTNELAVDPRQ